MPITGRGSDGEIQTNLKDVKWDLFTVKKQAFLSSTCFLNVLTVLYFMISLFKVNQVYKIEKLSFPMNFMM